MKFKITFCFIMIQLTCASSIFSMNNQDTLDNQDKLKLVKKLLCQSACYTHSIGKQAHIMSQTKANLIHPMTSQSISEELKSVTTNLNECIAILETVQKSQREQRHVATQVPEKPKVCNKVVTQCSPQKTKISNGKNNSLIHRNNSKYYFDPHDFACCDTRKKDKLQREQNHFKKILKQIKQEHTK